MARHPRRLGVLSLALAAAVATVGSLAPLRHVATTVEAAGPRPLTAAQLSTRLTREVYGYLPWWELDSGTDAYLRYDLLSTIALFSFRFAADGTIPTSSTTDRLTGPLGQTIIAHAHAAGVRVELSFSFAQTPEPNDAFFSDPAVMKTAIASAVALLKQTGADGINLDVERLHGSVFPAYGAFVGALRKAIRAWDAVGRVTVATNGNISGARMAAAALANGGDRAFLMGYSYRSSGSTPTGSNSPIDRADDGLDLKASLTMYRAQGLPMDRVLLGLPYYGLSYPTMDGTLHAARRYVFPAGAHPCSSWNPGFPTFLVKNQSRFPTDATVGYDPVEGTAWMANHEAATDTWCETYFDSPRSLRAKYDLATGQGLAGVGLWALGYDRGLSGYWAAIAASFSVLRYAGRDRYATAAAVSRASTAPGVSVAIVATGADAPDALGAGPVAASLRAPILLVTRTGIPAATATELTRLKPGRILVAGGTGAVSDVVARALRRYATSGRVDRIGGADRYATAADLSAATFSPGVPVAYVATGSDFPDALAASTAGGLRGGPVLLTRRDSLPATTAAELGRLKPATIVVVGGPSVVSDAVLDRLTGLAPTVTRAAGPDRYATAAAVSAATVAPDAPVAYIATGTAFPDGLTAAPVAAHEGGPLLLVTRDRIPDATLAELGRLRPHRIVVIGGPGAVSDRVLAGLRDALAADGP